MDGECDSSPVDDANTVGQLVAEMFNSLPVDTVAHAQTQRVLQTHLADFGRAVWLIDTRNPVIAPPICEDARIVEAENVDVRPMNKVVRQNADIAARVFRSDDPDARRIVAVQRRDELLRPAAGQHARVVVDAVQVVDVVDVSFQHRVVLRPRRLPGVAALHQGQVGNDAAGLARSRRRRCVELSPECITKTPICEHLVATIERQVKPVLVPRTARVAECWQEGVEKLELFSHVDVRDTAKLPRSNSTSNGDQRLCVNGIFKRMVD